MAPRIESGQLCTVEPVDVDDIVLCKVNGNEYLHFVKANGDIYGTISDLSVRERG